MSDDSEKESTALWKFVIGALLMMTATIGFDRFFRTGEWLHKATMKVPVQLHGEDAVLYYSASGIAGLYLVVSGYRSLTKR